MKGKTVVMRWLHIRHEYVLLGCLEQGEFLLIAGLTLLPFALAAMQQVVVSSLCVVLLVLFGHCINNEDMEEVKRLVLKKKKPTHRRHKSASFNIQQSKSRRYRSTSRKNLCQSTGALRSPRTGSASLSPSPRIGGVAGSFPISAAEYMVSNGTPSRPNSAPVSPSAESLSWENDSVHTADAQGNSAPPVVTLRAPPRPRKRGVRLAKSLDSATVLRKTS